MLDHRIHTFLTLCQEMNYRKTAERLMMTQPAVTQHIHGLEDVYSCTLFQYQGKTLSKTSQAEALELHARSVVFNETAFRQTISTREMVSLSVGATKTIGDFVVNDMVMDWLQNPNINLQFTVDNTKHLFRKLQTFQLDFLMIEGYFDKNSYDYRLIREEKLVGICGLNHPFAGKSVPLEKIFSHHILLREVGSGTRNVLENFLEGENYTTQQFAKISTISSFALIQEAVAKNIAISFVYQAIPEKNKNLATFTIQNHRISHELNYVYLKNTKALDILSHALLTSPTARKAPCL